jgi:hypothetical protein
VDDDPGLQEYIRQVLEAYRKTPGTMGTVRRADRTLAAQLYQRGVSVVVIENALVLAAARRLVRPAGAPPLGAIRSLRISFRCSRKCWNCAAAQTTSATCDTSSQPLLQPDNRTRQARPVRAFGADDEKHPARLRRG